MATKTTTRGTRPSSDSGSTLLAQHYTRSVKVVPIDMEDLREFEESMADERKEFAVGQFFAVGGFWLGAERFFTLPEPSKDTLFMVCIVCVIFGLVVMYFGHRQLNRRKAKIRRIITEAQSRFDAQEKSTTLATRPSPGNQSVD